MRYLTAIILFFVMTVGTQFLSITCLPVSAAPLPRQPSADEQNGLVTIHAQNVTGSTQSSARVTARRTVNNSAVSSQPVGPYQSAAWHQARARECDLLHQGGIDHWAQHTQLMLPPKCDSVEPVAAAPSRESVEAVVREAVLNVQLPDPGIEFDPDPSVNRWNAWAVYLPLWLLSDVETQTHTITHDGITITLTATPTVVFDMADGTTVTCARFTARRGTPDPWEPSPTCGHVYQDPGVYTITATATWDISWTASGYSGTLTSTTTNTRDIQVNEYSSIIIR